MKKFIVILALFMLFKPVLPVLEYIVFYDYIKNELCENKKAPELQCNGKCHLAKEMKKANENSDKSDGPRFSVELIPAVLPMTENTAIKFISFHSKKEKANLVYNNFYSHLQSDFIFRPPISA